MNFWGREDIQMKHRHFFLYTKWKDNHGAGCIEDQIAECKEKGKMRAFTTNSRNHCETTMDINFTAKTRTGVKVLKCMGFQMKKGMEAYKPSRRICKASGGCHITRENLLGECQLFVKEKP